MQRQWFGAILLLVVALFGASVSAAASTEMDAITPQSEIDAIFERMLAEGCSGGRTQCIKIIDVPSDFPSAQGEGEITLQGGETGWVVFLDQEQKSIVLTKKALYSEKTKAANLELEVWVQQDDVRIFARKARLVFGEGEFLFEEDVHLVREDEQRLEVKASSLEYDSETRRMVAEGAVEVREGDRTLWAEWMEYDDETRKLDLKRQVRVVQEGSELAIESLTVWLDDDDFKFAGYGPGEILLFD